MPTAPVSVVIPTYNSGHMVVQAVESALRQTLPPTEVIVVDDGSTDDTARRLGPFATRVKYVRQPNQGVSAARNHGLQLAGLEFVAFLDADDVWHPLKLRVQMDLFERQPDLALVGAGCFDWPARKFPPIDPNRPAVVTRVGWADLIVRNRLVTSSIVARRDVLVRAGQFDTTLQGPEDRDLWLRVSELAAMANVETPLVGYRDVPGSVSKQVERCRAGMLRILQKQDERGHWGGRWLLRRRAYSYVHHACSEIQTSGGRHGPAVTSCLRSLLWYPLPYRRTDVNVRAERLRRLAVTALRTVGLKSTPRPRAAELELGSPGPLQAERDSLFISATE